MRGKQLKILRIQHDIKAKDIALALGVSKAYISILENEVQQIPKHIYEKWTTYIETVSNNITIN
ncbi:helix-turn-helix transcriptional regulator [Alkalihalophilus pseudofirmus]|uniref:helix-turn-helix domain-containing protein n=1 Tax=Alkalihalophilus pseudofirmus TaxID=79885 RepID=UPI00259B8990|nr:helix-turn-helix transcriptional regulator [Alkalihalophilus pseudofirmus]WEG18531.1 helix-turn-helix transcriptional regulator [Alkalihalophilus pseudofirmus]